MLQANCGRILKARARMGILKTIKRQVDFWDKGKAEENIYYLKEQREKLRILRKKMLEMEGSLDASIAALQQATEITTKLKPLLDNKKNQKKRRFEFWDKDKGDENLYYLKQLQQQKEKLRALREKMTEMESVLEESIQTLEKIAASKEDDPKE